MSKINPFLSMGTLGWGSSLALAGSSSLALAEYARQRMNTEEEKKQ